MKTCLQWLSFDLFHHFMVYYGNGSFHLRMVTLTCIKLVIIAALSLRNAVKGTLNGSENRSK